MKNTSTIKKCLCCLILTGLCFLTACSNGGESSLPGTWVERDVPDPVHLEIMADGSYLKYQESTGKSMPMDTGKWTIAYEKLVLYTSLGLDGGVSAVGLTMPYDVIKSKDIIFIRIGESDIIYFEGVKQNAEGVSNEQ